MNELKTCPFCGDEAELTSRPIDLPGWEDGLGWTASCKGSLDADCCGSYYFDFKKKEWAVEQWNKRAGDKA